MSPKKGSGDITGARLTESGLSYTLSMMKGKYTIPILYALSQYGSIRFNELHSYIGTVTNRTLSATLKELVADGLVERYEYPQLPPKVEYSITDLGRSMEPIFREMCKWGDKHRPAPSGKRK